MVPLVIRPVRPRPNRNVPGSLFSNGRQHRDVRGQTVVGVDGELVDDVVDAVVVVVGVVEIRHEVAVVVRRLVADRARVGAVVDLVGVVVAVGVLVEVGVVGTRAGAAAAVVVGRLEHRDGVGAVGDGPHGAREDVGIALGGDVERLRTEAGEQRVFSSTDVAGCVELVTGRCCR